MTQLATTVSDKRRAKFVVGGAAVAITIFALVGWAMSRPGSTAYYLTVSELQAGGPPAGASDYRVNGVVVPGSVEKSGLETTFAITDGNATLPVVTDTPLPDTFRNRSEVVATGSFDGRSFTASQVLAKCPSKFKAKT